MMGCPVTDNERNDDENQHEVTLSAFKMSKHPIPFDQYDMFCEATGRKRPWGCVPIIVCDPSDGIIMMTEPMYTWPFQRMGVNPS